MIQGSGGILGPDLSNVGRDRTPAQIEQALRDPGAAPAAAGRGRSWPAACPCSPAAAAAASVTASACRASEGDANDGGE